MEFLVRIDFTVPAGTTDQQKNTLIAAESQRAAELAAQGVLRNLWRIPGKWANYAIWETPDATVLHELLTGLPLWPWASIDVQPLAKHPSDPAASPSPHPNSNH